MSCFIRFGNVGGSGGDIYEDAACWVAFFFCRGMPGGRGYRSGQGLRGIQLGSVRVERKRDARGRGYRSGQGLRRGIQLRFREMAKSIAAGPELASGSDSRPCRNNAVSRSPSSNHPSSAAAQPDATFLWLTLPTGRKKHAGNGSGLGVLS